MVPIAALSLFVFSDSTLTFFNNDPFWGFSLILMMLEKRHEDTQVRDAWVCRQSLETLE